ncbi:MAG: ABC transporter substrate-binding protein [Alphaproteobacteria bacterium]
MRRRDLLMLAAGAPVLRPVVALSQQQRTPVVGVLVTGTPDPGPTVREFRLALEELGYRDGHNFRLEIRSSEGDLGRLPALADDFVRQNVDVIAAWLTPAALAAKHATTDIPIVIIGAADPVGMGIVPNLARPGGNITGVAGLVSELTGKNIELLREMLPDLNRIAVLCNAPDPFSKVFLDHINQAGSSLGIEVVPVMVATGPQLDDAFRERIGRKIKAAAVQPSLPLLRVAELALHHRIATASPLASFPRVGGLIAYASVPSDQRRQAAVYVDKILKGAKPADLPLIQPTQFEFLLNMRTAKALGLTVPPLLLARADEIIE